VVTAEDHQIIGGLGSAVAEALAEHAVGTRLLRLGVQDTFGESGAPDAVLAHFKLDAAGLAEQIGAALSKA
jgi:transketolase